MNQQRRHLISGPRRIDATAVEGFGRIALNIGARLKLLIWLEHVFIERQADVSTSVRFRTVSGLGDTHLRAKIGLDYAFKISGDIQGLAAVSFLMPRFTDPLRAKRNHEEPSGAVIQIRKLYPRPMRATDFAETCARTLSLTVL